MVNYFSGKSFLLFVQKNNAKLDKCPKPIDTVEAITKYANELMMKKCLIRVESDTPELKRPRRLNLSKKPAKMEREGYYVWDDSVAEKSYNRLYTGLIVLGALFIFMFQIWPLWMKIGVWYISVTLLVILSSITIIRYIVWYV